MQLRAEATEHRGSHITPQNGVPGVWNAICIVLTGKSLPDEFRWGHISDASSFLRSMRHNCSCTFNKLGLYMLQIPSVTFKVVRISPQSTLFMFPTDCLFFLLLTFLPFCYLQSGFFFHSCYLHSCCICMPSYTTRSCTHISTSMYR
jgi:hypothetical protein